jgi:hypothetical protein
VKQTQRNIFLFLELEETGVSAAVQVKESPILMSGPMVRAILEGRKTQTRRVMSPQPIVEISRREQANRTWHVEIEWKGLRRRSHGYAGLENGDKEMLASWAEDFCPYGEPGERLWVRETFAPSVNEAGEILKSDPPSYCADNPVFAEGGPDDWRWTPSIFMPRWASRITLEITNVRVERLQEISEADAKDEGATPANAGQDEHGPIKTYRTGFVYGWNSINSKRKGCAWSDNPWVWCISFQKL